MLRFAEEIMLLLLDDSSGSFVPVPEWSLQRVLAGAVLMDLALENRIDTDTERLILLDKTPTGDDLLDPTLADIAETVETGITHYGRHLLGGIFGRVCPRDSRPRARPPRRGRRSPTPGRSLSLDVPHAALPHH